MANFEQQGPWGSQNGSGYSNGSGNPFENFVKKAYKQFQYSGMPGGPGKGGALRSLILVIVGLWLVTGFYRVQPDEQGVVLRFGEWVRNAEPGLNYHLPYPIETVYTPTVTAMNRIDSVTKNSANQPSQDDLEEGHMLTGDKNILAVTFTVLWQIRDVRQYLFNTRDPQATVKVLADSAVREIIAQSPIAMSLTDGRETINQKAQTLLQNMVDQCQMGIQIVQVKLQDVNPPGPVIDAFRDVQSASADQERMQNEALAYEKDIIPKARGEAAQKIQIAEAYKQKVMAKAKGEANRFLAVLEQYRKAKEVTIKRLYLEAMEQVLLKSQKVIIDSHLSGAGGVLPYLPLPEIKRRPAVDANVNEKEPQS